MTNIIGVKAYEKETKTTDTAILADGRLISYPLYERRIASDATPKISRGHLVAGYAGSLAYIRSLHALPSAEIGVLPLETCVGVAIICTGIRHKDTIKDLENAENISSIDLSGIVAGRCSNGEINFAHIDADGSRPARNDGNRNSLGYDIVNFAQIGRGRAYTSPLLEEAREKKYLDTHFPSVEDALAAALEQCIYASGDSTVNDRIQIGVMRKNKDGIDSIALYPPEVKIPNLEEHMRDMTGSDSLGTFKFENIYNAFIRTLFEYTLLKDEVKFNSSKEAQMKKKGNEVRQVLDAIFLKDISITGELFDHIVKSSV